MAKTTTCPHCGAQVYETDDVCMSCGQSLIRPAQPAPAPPSAEPPPEAQQPVPPQTEPHRAPVIPSQLPWTQRVIAFFGGFWEIFPWLVIGFQALFIALTLTGAPDVLFLLMYLFNGILALGLIFWMVVDVIDTQSGLWWLIIFFFCGPIGLIAYLLWGRT